MSGQYFCLLIKIHVIKVKGFGPFLCFIYFYLQSGWTTMEQTSDLSVLFTYDQSQSRIQIPWTKKQRVYVWKAVYVGQCVRGLKGWEIMSTKGAPGALDWVSLLPFLPLSLFHPPLPFSSGHFQHYPGTFKRLDHSFYNCATNACQQLGMKETNGEYNLLISKIYLPVMGIYFLVIL